MINEMKPTDNEKKEVTEEEAVIWIKNNNKDITPGEWIRAKYYEKIGIERNTEEDLEKQDQFENDKYYINFFTERTSAQIRNRYLSKLMIYDSQGQEVSQPRKKNQHLFIFDWDDTILCTSYLSRFQFLEVGTEVKGLLVKLDECSHKLLQKAIQKGQVYIITNAAKGWVEYSSKIYLPHTHAVIMDQRVRIISARSMFGEEFPNDFGRWKIQAFKSILHTIDKYLLTNMICIGDSNIEMEAAHSLSKQFEHSLVKTIKFRENPKPDELIKQQQLVFQRMKEIFDSTKISLSDQSEKTQKRKKHDQHWLQFTSIQPQPRLI